MGFLDGSFDGSNNGSNDVNIEVLLLGDSLESTDDKVLGSDEGINLILSDGKVIGTILVNEYGITLGLDFVTDLVSLDVSVDGYNDGKFEGLLLGESLKFT